MERKELTKELLLQLKLQGYKTLIAKGAPEQTENGFTQLLLASKQEMNNEETAEATWQTSLDDDNVLNDTKMKYFVDLE